MISPQHRTVQWSRSKACATSTGSSRWPGGSRTRWRRSAPTGGLPLILGGDCTITLGALAGFGDGRELSVLFDGDADLSTPGRSDSAVADTMGMTHMLGGGSPRLARFASRSPLLRPGQVVLFGFDPGELDTGQWTERVSRHLYAAPAPAVRADPAGQARQARGYLEAAPAPTWSTWTSTCCTPGCSRWRTTRIRRAHA